jgi:DNA-binding CsgD family transcriptional regulator
LHLALATLRPDAQLATTVAAAAAGASAQGARRQAVQLAEHALRLTLPGSAERSERLLALAGYLETAGEVQRLTGLLAPELGSLPAGAVRARAWLLLSEGAGVRSVHEFRRHLDLALAEARGDPAVSAYVLARKADDAAGSAVRDIGRAEAWALEALAATPDIGRDVELVALRALSWARSMSGHPIDDLCKRFRRASGAVSDVAASPERIAGQRLVWRGEIDQARVILTRLLALADEHGEATSYALLRLHLCELELRTGGWGAAATLLDEWAESSERDLLPPPMYERCRALVAAGRGQPNEAQRWAANAISAAEATGFGWDRLEGLRASGIAALLAHEPARAVDSLRAVWEHTQREGVQEPGVFPVAPELVEGLAELGELDEALVVTERLRELAERQQHPWGLATAKRCAAVVRLASGADHDQAAAALAQAAAEYEQLSLRFDLARSLLSLGRAHRRVRKWRAARDSLEQAVAAFEWLGSGGWADQARSDLSRVAARRPIPSGQLTAAEQRVVELAAGGRSNKEISQALFVTVHTVEAHLTHAYVKLGVRSRGQLAARLATKG